MNPIELYDILTLEDDKDYTVANMATYNSNEYLYLIEVDKNENVIESNQKIVKRVLENGEESVSLLEDEEEKEVSKIFFDLFKEMAEEEN
jgi:flagellar biosynthesis component FlhA